MNGRSRIHNAAVDAGHSYFRLLQKIKTLSLLTGTKKVSIPQKIERWGMCMPHQHLIASPLTSNARQYAASPPPIASPPLSLLPSFLPRSVTSLSTHHHNNRYRRQSRQQTPPSIAVLSKTYAPKKQNLHLQLDDAIKRARSAHAQSACRADTPSMRAFRPLHKTKDHTAASRCGSKNGRAPSAVNPVIHAEREHTIFDADEDVPSAAPHPECRLVYTITVTPSSQSPPIQIFIAQNDPVPDIGYYRRFSHALKYRAYNNDFGPIDFPTIAQFIQVLHREISNCHLVFCRKLVFYVEKRGIRAITNAAMALGCYLILQHGLTPEDLAVCFHGFAFEPYPDIASYISTAHFSLTVHDVWAAIFRAYTLGWFRMPRAMQREHNNNNDTAANHDDATSRRWGRLDLDQYLLYDDPMNIDLHEIVPGKLIAFRCPVPIIPPPLPASPQVVLSSSAVHDIGNNNNTVDHNASGGSDNEEAAMSRTPSCTASFSSSASTLLSCSSHSHASSNQSIDEEPFAHDDNDTTDDLHWNSSFSSRTGSDAFSTPALYLAILKTLIVSDVVQLNRRPSYDTRAFASHQISHHPLCFDEDSHPPSYLVFKFFRIVDRARGLVAVHSHGGLGRTGVLVAMYLMRTHQFLAKEAIAWVRFLRPWSIIGTQQLYLCNFQCLCAAAIAATPPVSPPDKRRLQFSFD